MVVFIFELLICSAITGNGRARVLASKDVCGYSTGKTRTRYVGMLRITAKLCCKSVVKSPAAFSLFGFFPACALDFGRTFLRQAQTTSAKRVEAAKVWHTTHLSLFYFYFSPSMQRFDHVRCLI